MRAIVVPVLALALLGAGEPPQSALDNPAYTEPAEKWDSLEEVMARRGVLPPPPMTDDAESCSDTIHEAREASGQAPLLEREPASPDKPHAIYAVDRRQDGCSVMVMMGDPDDIRPLPLPAESPQQVIPADAAPDAEDAR